MAGAIDENGAVIVNYNNQSTKIDKNGYEAYVDANHNTQSGTYTVKGGETHNYVILAGTDNKKYICDYHGDIREVTSIDANGVITAGSAVTNAPVTKIVGGTNGFNVDGHQNATAFGNATRATAAESTAWGQGSIASGEASTAFGIKSKAEGKNSLAGLGGQAVNENSIALGKDTKANNAQQAVSVAIGENAEASGARSLAIGFGVKGKVTEGGVEKDDTTLTQTTASGESAVSIGTDTQAAGQHSIAFGSHTQATKDSSLAIGYDTHATEASAVAIGSGTKVNRGYGVAIGLSALAGIDESDPDSKRATSFDGAQTVAVGYYARATATNAAALGAATSANINGGVALGYGSATTRAAGNKVNGMEQKAYLKPASVDSTNNSTWTSTAGAVSVGNVGAKQSITRQITDVAAGSLDTDAVNVAQLKAAGVTVTSADNSVGITTTTDSTDYHTNYDLKVATATLNQEKSGTGDTAVPTGKITVTNPTVSKTENGKTTQVENKNAYVTGDSVATAINNSGFTLTTSKSAGTVSGTTKELINPGETVTLDAGKNIAITQAQNKITFALADDVNAKTVTVTGKDGKDGKDAVSISGKDGAGHIGLTGPKGADGKDGTSIDLSTDYGTKTLNSEKNTTVDGVEKASRIIYSDARGDHEVATMDDGQKYHGDFGETANVALNHQVNIVGDISSYNANHPDSKVEQSALTDGTANVGVETTKDDQGNATLTIKLNKNLTGLNSTTYTTRDGDKTYTSTINGGGLTIKEGDTDHNPISITKNNITMGGQQVHNVAAGTEDNDAVNMSQLKAVSGSHTAVTVNDKSNPTIATAGDKTYGDYAGGETDNLHIAAMKGTDGKLTYNIKLNDQLSIGKKGADGTNGKVTVDTKGGTTVIIGHDGENGKDGLFVRGDDGKDGKSGISITGPNGLDGIDGTIGIAGKDGKDAVSISGKDGAGHIGLTGPKGADGKDGTSIDLSTDYGTKTLNSEKNTTVDGVEKASRIIYSDARGDHEVATMDDGQKYHGDFGETANVALNHQVNIVGDISSYNANHPDSKVEQSALTDGTANVGVETTKDDQGNATLTIKLNKNLTGLESVTAGGAKLGTHQDGDSSLAVYEIGANGKPVSKTNGNGKTVTDKEGTYVTGLTNKAWNGKTYVSGRAATEDQLMQITSSIVNQGATGGFGLSANGQNVKQDLGKTIAINGDGTYSPDGKETEAGNISTSVEKGAIKVFLNKDLNINSTTMEGEDKDGNTVSNVTNAEGSTITKTDANGKQSSTTVNAGSLTIKDGDGTTTIGGGKATIGGVTINGTGENDGSDQHNSTIKGLSNTTFDTTHLNQYINSDRAATEGQLKDVYDMASKHTTVTVNGKDAPSTDGNLILKKEDKNGSANYDLALNNDITLGDKDSNGKLTVKSKDGTKSIITDGERGTLTFKNGNDETSMKAADSAKGVDGTTDIKRVAVDGHTVATMDDGMKFAGDSGEALKQKLNSTTNIKGGAAGELSDGNIGVVSDGKDTLTVKLAKDIRGLDSVEATTVNATTVNSSSFNIAGDSNHSAITIKQGNVNMGGNKIEGVAPGKVSQDSTDAVNGSQLWQRDQAINGLSGSVNKLGNRINRVGAGAAALAALHPLDFDPDDKWDFAAGYGNYRGANAAAVGAYYRPNEDTMFSVGGSFGGGENMVNAGVSIKLGQGNHVSTSRVAMAKEIKDLRQNVANLNAIVNRQSALIDKLTGTNAGMIKDKGNDLFPDVPANHWAYEYVTKLKHAGILTGYPDGNFDGDRMMTRYEFAAIVYRAIMAGAASNPALNQDGTLDKLANEFSSEMKYIRIDTIAKDKNGKPTIERVRVISDAK